MARNPRTTSSTTTSMAMKRNITFSDGCIMPMVGFGTYKLRGQILEQALDAALASGYRLIDTAIVYENEDVIGNNLMKLLTKYKLNREDIYITSKLPPSDNGNKAELLEAIGSSLKKLKVSYIDLYLIHWPGDYGMETWKALVEAKERGMVKSIGVSNYTVHQLEELLASKEIPPVLNQIQWHPYHHHEDIYEFCKTHNIVLQAYSSLGGSGAKNLLADEELTRIAFRIEQTPAQILLVWALKQNACVIPRSSNAGHIKENTQLDFDLSNEDFNMLFNIIINRPQRTRSRSSS